MIYCWIAYSTDKYELPFAVAETSKELAEIMGVKASSIITRKNRKTAKPMQYKVVRWEWTEDEYYNTD